MDEKNKNTEFEGVTAQEPSLAEMPLTELKEVDYTFGNRDFGYPHTLEELEALHYDMITKNYINDEL